ncbi:MAG: serine/threonine-protein kinase, partial [Pirellulales bacterium]
MVIEAVEQQAELLLADAKDRWRSGEDVDAPTFLSEHPEITARRSLVLDVAYEDFCQHVDATDDKAVEAFLNRFPSFRNSLRKQIEVHQYLATHEDMLALAADADWPQPGDTIFDFKVLEELGRGTFARVYLCTQSGLGDRQVVVKVGHEGAYEADMLGKFSHRNIMPVHSVHRDELSGMSALCMPYRGRSTLCDVLDVAFAQGSCPKKARPILAAASRWTRSNEADPEDRPWQARLQRMNYVDAILELGVRLAEGLQHAHDQGILHGDLKPSNVLVTPAGTALVLDFNLAWQEQTRTAAPGGTLPYMAPEQIQSTIIELDGNPPRVDARADIFSLGAMLYELMCGRLPFPPAGGSLGVRATALQLLEAHHRGPRPLNQLNRQIGNDVATCIARCLSAEPAQRPASMAELAADLRRCLIPSRRVGRWLQVHQRWATGTTVLLVA